MRRPEHVVFGRHAVEALLRHRPDIVRALFAADANAAKSLQSLASAAGVRFTPIDKATLDAWCEGERHQQLCAAVTHFSYVSHKDAQARIITAHDVPLWLVVDQLQDPRNLGALVRSAVAFGAHAVLLPKDRTAPVSGVTIKASAGAAFAVPIVQVTNLRRGLDQLREDGVWIYGLAADGPTPVRSVDWRQPAAIVVGAEGDGLRQLTRKHCDALVSIPAGGMESLNAATAGAVALYEAACQRQKAR